jgi:plasmid stabilization system protein ParE
MDSRRRAQQFVAQLKKSAGSILTFPEAGSIVPEYDDPNIREIVHGKYRIVYRIRQPLIEILTVFHGARRLHSFD